ncbi:ANTAR domain-containing protein [Jatrophihabitans sp.]|uniref:ANTAR domain-containing protein n=1 Tax=Jatrophihabitans sp. TaxID=1932789 RepID=UPI0030C67377|nr:hypothetical protein [Jatrophihabitans sp.]
MSDKARLLAQLARAVAAHADAHPLPLRLCLACVRILGVDGCALTVAYTNANRVTLCATDPVAERLEDLQDVLGEGPGPEAYESGRLIVARLGADGDAAGRWPMFNESAHAAVGALTLYALPMRPDSVTLGVLTLHQRAAEQLEYDLEVAQFLADALGAALLNDARAETDLLSGPWSSRSQIHQATGMVVAQLRISPADALVLLRAHAYAHDTSLAAIAADVLQRRLDFSTTDDSGDETR